MNYAEARELTGGRGWHFTVKNDDRIWTHQCCRRMRPATAADIEDYRDMGFDLLPGELVPDGPHPPHATRAEAEACFNEWRRAPERFVIEREVLGDWTGCRICDHPTKSVVCHRDAGGPHLIALCLAHLSIEIAASTVTDATRVAYS